MYFGLYLLSKLVFGGKKKEAAVPAIAGHSHGKTITHSLIHSLTHSLTH